MFFPIFISLILDFCFFIGFLVRFSQSRTRAYLFLSIAVLGKFVVDAVEVYVIVSPPQNNFTHPDDLKTLDILTKVTLVIQLITMVSDLILDLTVITLVRKWIRSMKYTIAENKLRHCFWWSTFLMVMYIVTFVVEFAWAVVPIVTVVPTATKGGLSLVVFGLRLLGIIVLLVVLWVLSRAANLGKSPGEARKHQQIGRPLILESILLIRSLLSVLFGLLLGDVFTGMLVVYVTSAAAFAVLLFPKNALVGFDLAPNMVMTV